jgi:hypothetical protein
MRAMTRDPSITTYLPELRVVRGVFIDCDSFDMVLWHSLEAGV